MSRTIAFIEWGVAVALLGWFVVFYLLSQTEITLTLGVVVTSIFFGIGLAVSLGINGAVHFRRRPLRRSEVVLLIIEAALLLLLVVVGVADQVEYDSIVNTDIGSSLGHWLDWFMPLWVPIGPVALTVLILGLVFRSTSSTTSGPTAPPAPTP